MRKFAERPDWLQIWPAHGAGSACGKGISAIPQSTLGYEKRFNWAFRAASEAEFVKSVLAGQPEPPKYFAMMKRLNKEGPRILNGFPHPPLADVQTPRASWPTAGLSTRGAPRTLAPVTCPERSTFR